MRVTASPLELPGVFVVEPDQFVDDRGFFMETYHRENLAQLGLNFSFVQDNHSRSRHGVLRGFHYQDHTAPQTRLVRCSVGEIMDVIVDLQVDSPTFGRHLAIRLSAENRKQLLIPPAFAHGFLVLSDVAEVQYKVTGHHVPRAERSLAWNDPDIAIPWPIAAPFVSERDSQAPSLKDYLANPGFPAARAGVGTGR